VNTSGVNTLPVELEQLLFDLIVEGVRENYIAREDNTIHVSNLLNFCPREYAIMEAHDVAYNTKTERASLMELINYEIGDALHHTVRKALTTTKTLKGEWRSCKCNSHTRYQEFKVITDKFGRRIEGNIDMVLSLLKTHYFGEIKSIGKEDYKTLTEPLVDHTCQLSLYLYLAEIEKKRFNQFFNLNFKEGFVIYVCKLAVPTPIRVFHVRRNESFLKEIVKPRLEELKTFSKKGNIPKRICSTSSAPRAKKCKTLHKCWENK
jgi:hypothetical protein